MMQDIPITHIVKTWDIDPDDPDFFFCANKWEALRVIYEYKLSWGTTKIITLPIPLSHLLYFSGLREAGEAIINEQKPYWEIRNAESNVSNRVS